MQKISLIIIAVFLIVSSVYSQQTNSVSQNWCGSIEAMEANFKKHPELKNQFENYQKAFDSEQAKINTSSQKTAVVNYTIPVVFHVLHQYGVENISDAQINDQIAIFNRDFNLQNSDTSVAITPFKNIIGNVHFTFVLAKLDPNGNCTSGIDRFYDVNSISWEGNYSDYIYTWDPTMYLNFYVVKGIASGAAGFAYYPGSLAYGSPMDGIVILQDYVGSIGTSSVLHSRALTHEVGHWFNLQHTWGNTNNPGVACGDDQVFDTPITKGFTSCSNLTASQICNTGVSENYQNYMDYSYCCVMFTNGQVNRMNLAANSSISGRNNLGSSGNLLATGITPAAPCAPAANFQSNKQTVCTGTYVDFTDLSNISTPTNWQWSFEGGTPNSSSAQNPVILYNTPGTYSVQLVSSNAAGSSLPETKIGYITVLPSPVSTYITEGFEGASIPNATWSVRNISASNTNWIQTSFGAATGAKSIYIDQSVLPGSVVELYSPNFNFNAMPGVSLTLKWAGAERDVTSTSNDAFVVMFSSNCGLTWTPRLTRYIKTSTSGVSGIVNGNFYPTPGQFRQESIPLTGFTIATNILFKLKFTAETGSSNNFYVDDINLTSTITNISENQTGVSNIEVFPSPASDNINVAFDLLEGKKIEIGLTDVLGKTLKIISKQDLPIGYHNINVPLTDVSKGIYFITININDIISTRKIIVD